MAYLSLLMHKKFDSSEIEKKVATDLGRGGDL
jgi:hypothetical protein